MTIEDLKKLKQASYRYFTEVEMLEAVKQDGYALRYCNNPSETVMLEAVKRNGDALQYCKNL